MKPRVLFVDDDPRAGELFQRFVGERPYVVEVFRDPRAALAAFESAGADLVVTDLRMPEMSGTELLAQVRAHDPDVPVVIMTAYSTVDGAIEALRLGATDFLKKPYDMDELLVVAERALEGSRLRAENRWLRAHLGGDEARAGLVGDSPAMQELRRLIQRVAQVRCNVIVEGESGTGKELAARALHELGPDAARPFLVIDCGALSDTLLESELFGHERGAFTGAQQQKQGLLEVASGGTVFLDEIGNISDAMQMKLLRVVQEQQVTRVGGVRPIRIDVRFIAASNRALERLVAEGGFRHDLFHRLDVVRVRMPPLREHREDVPALLAHFLAECNARYGRAVQGFDPASVERLAGHDWPGNVRELRNLVERAVALADVPRPVLEDPARAPAGAALDADWPTLETLERRYIERALAHCGGNRERTAALLGINKTTLWRRLRGASEDG